MSIVAISDLKHTLGNRQLFDSVSLTLEYNSKIGLIGKNGSGKTTLFKIILGEILPENGVINRAKNKNIGYLSQEPQLPQDTTLYDFVLHSRQDFIALKKKLEDAQHQLTLQNSEENLKNLERIQHQFELIDGYNFETELKLVLTGLNFPISCWNRKISTFSGGELTRIQLAQLLLGAHDLLLLDEPTNHLDLTMIIWLESYLRNSDKPYVIISHDRKFLDKTVTKILELKDGKLNKYTGNYSTYESQSALQKETLLREYQKQQKKIKQAEEFIQKNIVRDSTTARAKSRRKMLEKMDLIELPKESKNLELTFETDDRSGNDVFIFEDVSFGFEDAPLARNVSLRIGYQDRIAVIGKNGCGKTTFLNILNGSQKQQSGIVKMGANLKIGYYDQMQSGLDESITVMDTIWSLVPLETQGYVRGYLAKFGFYTDDLEKKVGLLSGGERARLHLAKLIHERPNLLLLDEPTNHLDIPLISSLEKALQEYDGTVVFVSHDRYFIDNVATKKFVFLNNTISETDADIEIILQEEPKQKQKTKPRNTKTRRINPILLKKLETEIEAIYQKIDQIDDAINQNEAVYSDENSYNDPNKIIEITKKIKTLKEDKHNLKEEVDLLEHKYLQYIEHNEVNA
jgi:ATP-binding cassette subfamily F protein 3